MNRQSPSPEFDPRIADWLESDPDDAPGRILETVLAAFPSIPQRRASRVPWRSLPMSAPSRLAAAAATRRAARRRRPAHCQTGCQWRRRSAAERRADARRRVPVRIGRHRRRQRRSRPPATASRSVTRQRGSKRPRSSPGRRARRTTGAAASTIEVSGTTARFSGAGQALAQGQTADDGCALRPTAPPSGPAAPARDLADGHDRRGRGSHRLRRRVRRRRQRHARAA